MRFITGLDRVVYGVEDLAEAERFFHDWGLRLLRKEGGRLVFATLELSQVEIRRSDNADLPPAIEPGSTAREVVWGVDRREDLDRLLEKVSAGVEVKEGADGVFRCLDPIGLSLGFQISQRKAARVVGSPTNCYGKISRINRPSALYDRATPVRLSHIVLFTDTLEEHVGFYRDILGFQVSDCYPGEGYFMRCQEEGGHHDLFLLRNPEVKKRGLNHVSFMVRDIYEVFGGGINMSRRGWETQIGPGRHPISSAMFWYVRCPAGALTEYYADEDYVTKDWVAREFKKTPENFAEWSIAGGIDAVSRKQKA